MEEYEELSVLIRKRADQRILFSLHALHQMYRPDRMISTKEIRMVIQEGEIIEGYPENAKGPSCLMLGKGVDDRPIHIVCSPKDEYLAIITAYLPSEQEWSEDFRVRKKP